ncbi:unnamed protein product [Discula destructiva]
MSTLEELDDLMNRGDGGDDKDKKGGDDKKKDGDKPSGDGDAEMKDAEEEENLIDDEILQLSTLDIQTRRRLLDNDARIMKSEFQRLQHEKTTMNEKIKENREKIQNNRSAAARAPLSSFAFDSMLTPLALDVGNSPISLAMLSNCLTWTPPTRPRRRVPTSTWTQQESANRPSSRPPRDRPSSCRSSVWSTLKISSPAI